MPNTQDSFTNPLANLGIGTTALTNATRYLNTRFTWDWYQINALYRSNWIARRIIETVPKDMTRTWVRPTMDLDAPDLDLINKAEKQTKLRASILKGLTWGRLFGGAAGLIMIDGQEDILDQPLDLDAVMPGDFKGLLIVDRWSGVYPKLDLVSDISDPEFGLPEYYEFRSPGATSYTSLGDVHHSRIIRFTGMDLPYIEQISEQYWGMSVLENVIRQLERYDNITDNTSELTYKAQLSVIKYSNLKAMLGLGSEKQVQNFAQTLQAQAALMNSKGILALDKDDEYQSHQYSFGGLSEITDKQMLDVSGAAQIPVTRLFGRSPAGMNATGESDMQNYFEMINAEQESKLRPALEKVFRVLYMSTLGEVPADLDFAFNPLEGPDSDKLANILKSKSEAIFGALDHNIITPRRALTEFKQLSEEVDVLTTISDEDIAKASDDLTKPEDLLQIGLEDDDEEMETTVDA